jgi:hypothetical protein
MRREVFQRHAARGWNGPRSCFAREGWRCVCKPGNARRAARSAVELLVVFASRVDQVCAAKGKCRDEVRGARFPNFCFPCASEARGRALGTTSDIVKEARSVILVGGTMQPMEFVRQQLFPDVPRSRLRMGSWGHVVPAGNVLCCTLGGLCGALRWLSACARLTAGPA